MNRTITVLKRFACAVVLALSWAAAAVAQVSAPPATRSLDRIVAVVNDEAITESELDTRTRVALGELLARLGRGEEATPHLAAALDLALAELGTRGSRDAIGAGG
jgi:parvulin-like peptidyl-prolyl isomerase